MKNRYFRAGVGTVIYRKDSTVAWFRRAAEPVGIWQFQQGGIDVNESKKMTLWRELKQEVGLLENDIDAVIEYPRYIAYEDYYASHDNGIERLGQVHRWFFLKLKNDTPINLANATDGEFDDVIFIPFEAAIEATHTHKQPVYRELYDFFMSQVVSTLRK